MTTTETKPLCARCGTQDPVMAMDCRKCHYTALVMLYVHKYWRSGELEGLRDQIRVKPLFEMIRDCPPQAVLMRKIYSMIRAFAYPSKMHEDELKRSVCDEITRYMAAMKGIANYESEKGEGSYIKAWNGAIGGILKGGVVKP